MKQTLTLFVLFTSGIFFPVFSQSWSKVQHWGGTGTETCAGLAIAADGEKILAGSFENQIQFDNNVLNATGEEDVFVCKLDVHGKAVWAKRAGSRLEDEVADIALDANENLVVAGTYWLEGEFDQIKLTAGENPKAIFVAKYNSAGQVLWAKTLNGTGLKGVKDVVIDSENSILLAGFFEKNLEIGDTLLTASGATDLFLAKFTADGTLLWAVRQGKKGDTRATALALTATGDAIVAGFYNDTTAIADTILTSGTLDQDAFVARFDKDGVPIWAKKAGGVFDSDVTGIVLDASDQIYVAGYFLGVMRLSPNISIQSSTGNSDFFLLKYNSEGTPLMARALGGRLLDQALDIAMQNNILLVSGFYQGDLTLDSFTLSTGSTLSGFVAGFDDHLQTKWLKNLASNAFLYASQIAADTNGNIWVGGSFVGNARLDALEINAVDFNLFLAALTSLATGIQKTERIAHFQVFPNPTDGKVFIQTNETKFYLQISNAAGKTVLNGANLHALDFSNLPKGMYYLHLKGDFAAQTFKIVWN